MFAFVLIFAILLPLLFLHMFGRLERVVAWRNGMINRTSIALTYLTGFISLIIVPGEFDWWGVAGMILGAVVLYFATFWIGNKVCRNREDKFPKYFIITGTCTIYTCGIVFHSLTYLG
jgi:hypothetical protein